MKSENKTPAELRRRLLKSLLTGIVIATLFVSGYCVIRNGRDADETPIFLRKVLEFNAKIASRLQSDERLSVKKKNPGAGKKPRVNGDLGLKSEIDLQKYQVAIESGEKKISLPLSAFYALPKVGYATDFRCIEGWTDVVHYAGAKFSDFLNAYQLGKKTDGSYYRYVALVTPDEEYYVSIDMDSMLHPQTVLAYEMNGQPLSLSNGAPLRLIIPIKYGIKSLKRIGKIYFSDTRPPDYWAENGYDWFAGM
jgi:DMSO/TMAO reductase YedYZ molybdopterin-dependent catalytic subunit